MLGEAKCMLSRLPRTCNRTVRGDMRLDSS